MSSDQDTKPDKAPEEPRPAPSSVMDKRARKLAKKTGIAFGWHEQDMSGQGPKRIVAGCEICDWHLGSQVELPSIIKEGPAARAECIKQNENNVWRSFVRESLKRGCTHVAAYMAEKTGKPIHKRPEERLSMGGVLTNDLERALCEATGIAFGEYPHSELEARMIAGCEICGYSTRTGAAVNDANRDAVTAAMIEQMDEASVMVLCEHWPSYVIKRWGQG